MVEAVSPPSFISRLLFNHPVNESHSVAEITKKNRHVANIPAVLRHPDHIQVTKADEYGHAIAQLFGFVGIPASTIPLMNNVKYWEGVAIGTVVALVCCAASSSHLNPRIKDYMDWWKRSASMNALGKSILGGLHVTGISANIFFNLYSSNGNLYPYFQGALAGGLVVDQSTKFIMSVVQEKLFSPSKTDAAASQPLVGASDQDQSQTAINIDDHDGDGDDTKAQTQKAADPSSNDSVAFSDASENVQKRSKGKEPEKKADKIVAAPTTATRDNTTTTRGDTTPPVTSMSVSPLSAAAEAPNSPIKTSANQEDIETETTQDNKEHHVQITVFTSGKDDEQTGS